jgi:DNA polymerase-3 subunit alpha
VFPEAWAVLGDRIKTDTPLLVKGGYSKRDQDVENPTFIVEGVQRFEELRIAGQVVVALELQSAGGGSALEAGGGVPQLVPEIMADVRAVAESHPGVAPVEVRWRDANGASARFRSRSLKVQATSSALKELRALLGEERVRLVRGS